MDLIMVHGSARADHPEVEIAENLLCILASKYPCSGIKGAFYTLMRAPYKTALVTKMQAALQGVVSGEIHFSALNAMVFIPSEEQRDFIAKYPERTPKGTELSPIGFPAGKSDAVFAVKPEIKFGEFLDTVAQYNQFKADRLEKQAGSLKEALENMADALARKTGKTTDSLCAYIDRHRDVDALIFGASS